MKQLKNLIKDTERQNSLPYLKPSKNTDVYQANNEHLFRVLDRIDIAFILFDNDTRYLYANSAALQLIGKQRKDIQGKKITEVFSNVSEHPLYTKMVQVIKKKKPEKYEYYLKSTEKWICATFYPTDIGIVACWDDITEQKKLEIKKQQFETAYLTLTELAPDVLYSVDLHGTITSLSPAFEKLSGWKPKKWIGKNFTELIHPDDLPFALEKFKTGLKKDIPPYELRVITKAGKYRVGEFHNRRNTQNGKVVGKIGVVRDVTEQKTLFTELDTRARQQSAIAELGLATLRGVKLPVLLHQAIQLLVKNLNVEFAEVLEMIPGEKKLIFRMSVGWGDTVQENVTRLSISNKTQAGFTLLTKRPVIVTDLAKEKRFSSRQLIKHKIISGVSVLIYRGRDIYGVLGIHTKSPRKFTTHDVDFVQSVSNIIAMAMQSTRSESEVRQREKLFRSLIEYSLDAIRLVNSEGQVQYVTPSIRKILGYTPDEYKKMTVFDIMHPEDVHKYKKVLQKTIDHPAKPYKLMYRLRHKNGKWCWIEGIGRSLLHVAGVEAVVSNFRDVTQQVQMQNDVELLNKRLRLAVKMAHMARWSIDLNTGEISIGKRSRNILGIPLSKPLKRKDFRNMIAVEDRDRFIHAMETAIQKRARLDTEFRLITTKGIVKWIWVMGQADYVDKKPVRFDVVGLDISSSKERDERKDEFISMASHELKTPITSLQIFVQLLERQLISDERASVAVRKVKGQTERLKEIINDLLDVSRIETGKMKLSKERFYIDDLIDDTLAGLRDAAVKHELLFKRRSHVKVYADRFRIYQVLVNLITNAIKYSPSANQVIICTVVKGKQVVVSVQDFGIGIPKTHQQQIFEKLYQINSRNQNPQSGLGMGLYISKEIVNEHSGSIGVESKKGKGSTFYFSLPITE